MMAHQMPQRIVRDEVWNTDWGQVRKKVVNHTKDFDFTLKVAQNKYSTLRIKKGEGSVRAQTCKEVWQIPRVVGDICNISTWEAEAGRFWVPGQPGIHRETLPKKKNWKRKEAKGKLMFEVWLHFHRGLGLIWKTTRVHVLTLHLFVWCSFDVSVLCLKYVAKIIRLDCVDGANEVIHPHWDSQHHLMMTSGKLMLCP
jgi:hypothetical protein